MKSLTSVEITCLGPIASPRPSLGVSADEGWFGASPLGFSSSLLVLSVSSSIWRILEVHAYTIYFQFSTFSWFAIFKHTVGVWFRICSQYPLLVS